MRFRTEDQQAMSALPDQKFGYPPDIRKAIYTTNAIESLNSVIRQAIKKRKVLPTDDPVRKGVCLAINDISKKAYVVQEPTAGDESLYY